MGKFKVGDRVRAKESSISSIRKGDVFTVTGVIEDRISFVNASGRSDGWVSDKFQLVTPAFTPAIGSFVRLTADNDHWGKAGDVGKVTAIEEDGARIEFLEQVHGAKSWLVSFGKLEAWAPKVGERVRYKRRDLGEATVIEIVDGGYVKVDTHGIYRICTERLTDIEPAAPVVAQAQPAALKIEAGKTYRSSKDKKVGPMVWNDGRFFVRSELGTWNADGTASHHHKPTATTFGDLVALWEEPANDNAAAAVASKPKFKVGDRVIYEDGDKATVVDVRGDSIWVKWSDDSVGEWSPNVFTLVPGEISRPTAIVALIEDGQPKPAIRPTVHHTTKAATAEAARLAGIHKGSEFGVYVLASTAKQDKPVYKHEWQRLAAEGEKIGAIKALRSMAALDLLSAKKAVETFINKVAA